MELISTILILNINLKIFTKPRVTNVVRPAKHGSTSWSRQWRCERFFFFFNEFLTAPRLAGQLFGLQVAGSMKSSRRRVLFDPPLPHRSHPYQELIYFGVQYCRGYIEKNITGVVYGPFITVSYRLRQPRLLKKLDFPACSK